MTKLKLSGVQEEKPVKLSVTLPAGLHLDLIAYAQILAHESGQKVEPAQLIAPMLERFIASDRGFRKARGVDRNANPKPSTTSVKSNLATLSAQD
ncbi:DUF2274 domain-containing protein [Methylocystis sp. SC2]|uniref:DUF2274 domain-containing protein n=1 Tax=Methylocystis sp. (strain SC2) TaxID=187303 RepID=UPI000316F302|nr:DUF2274 domain-containing protein [Methylocystis sp. SC2]